MSAAKNGLLPNFPTASKLLFYYGVKVIAMGTRSLVQRMPRNLLALFVQVEKPAK